MFYNHISIVYTPSQINKIRESNRIVAKIHASIKEVVKPGITTKQLEEMAENLIRREGAVPAFKGYKGYPHTLCTSINDTVVHGYPDDKALDEGDLLSVDVGVIKDGYYGDACISIGVGKRGREVVDILEATDQAMVSALAVIEPGVSTGTIGKSIDYTAKLHGYDVIKAYVGHSIGCILHDFPNVPNYGRRGEGSVLKEGMVICIEPMLTSGGSDTYRVPNRWDVKTSSGYIATHIEHCIAITKDGYDLLSKQ